jgi:hypothetical protein
VKKPYYLVALILAGFIFVASAIAAEDGQEEQSMSSPTGDEIVAMCEEKYSADSYPDEDERNKVIDECINEKINATD